MNVWAVAVNVALACSVVTGPVSRIWLETSPVASVLSPIASELPPTIAVMADPSLPEFTCHAPVSKGVVSAGHVAENGAGGGENCRGSNRNAPVSGGDEPVAMEPGSG